jgi:hypothetical protein
MSPEFAITEPPPSRERLWNLLASFSICAPLLMVLAYGLSESLKAVAWVLFTVLPLIGLIAGLAVLIENVISRCRRWFTRSALGFFVNGLIVVV